jgi:hypothetical protein
MTLSATFSSVIAVDINFACKSAGVGFTEAEEDSTEDDDDSTEDDDDSISIQ